jgi:hypothetical protein
LPEWRKLVCGVIVAMLPASLPAQFAGGAMLHNDGGTYLNDEVAPNSTAIFADAFLQTQRGHHANIEAAGTTVFMQPETVAQFQGNLWVLVHGTLQMGTSRGMPVLVGCLTITPTSLDQTQFDVIDMDGKVKIIAHKNDVKIHSHAAVYRGSKDDTRSDAIVHEGEEATREERCGLAMRASQPVGANNGIMDSRWAIGAGGVAVFVIACLGLCHDDDPLSPWKP